ncbi:MAG: flagellar motor protein MotD [Gammaproteobacteria bacterium]|nr:flagellar motor protein MotD [Gammaproteobacteria bacterium]
MARKAKHEEHENHERWLVSYADFITLLFAFFVVMYSVSAINEGKFRVLSDALMAAFRGQPKTVMPIQFGKPARIMYKQPNDPIMRPGAPVMGAQQPNPVAIALPMPMTTPMTTPAPSDVPQHRTHSKHGLEDKQAVAIKQMSSQIEHAMHALIKEKLIVVRRSSLYLAVEIRASILFPSGSARLQPDAVPILAKISKVLRKFPNPIHVEGFTDNRPIHTVEYPSNWELSAARAVSVVQLFMRAGIDPRRMAAIGLGKYRPVATNATKIGRNQNRRVVLMILAHSDSPDMMGVIPQRLSSGAARAAPPHALPQALQASRRRP